MNIENITVSACRGAFDRNVYEVNLIDWLENVRPDHPRNDWDKKQLPAIMPHGIFVTRKQDTLLKHSGLVQIDIDAKHQGEIFDADQFLHETTYSECVLAAGKSCSGTGVYMLIAVDGLKSNNFRDCADCAIMYIEQAFKVSVDSPVSMNLSSLRFASPYAPYINFDVKPLDCTK